MSRGGGDGTKRCTSADGRIRLKSAREHLDACIALESVEGIANDAVATLAIVAAIAAADAICCAERGEHAGNGNHNDAIGLLNKVDGSLGDDLAKTLANKNTAAYGTRTVSDAELKTCRRVADRLFVEAQRRLQTSPG